METDFARYDDQAATDGNYITERDHDETTMGPKISADEKLTTIFIAEHSAMETTEVSTASQRSSLEDLSPSSLPSSTESTSTSHSLEFIPFLEEDALASLSNETIPSFIPLPVNPINAQNEDSEDGALPFQEYTTPLLKPLQLKFFNSTTEESYIAQGSSETEDALPILVENDVGSKPPTEFNLGNSNNAASALSPGSSSLYNNGYYPHGSIIKDDDGPADELQISEGEVITKKRGSGKVAIEAIEESPTTTPVPQTSSSFTTKKAEPPLKAISSFDKFIPSYAPVTVPTNVDTLEDVHPSRTYSKFGIQDAPLYRYDHHNAPPVENSPFNYNGNRPSTSTGMVYHHRYYNEPEEIPTSRIQNPYDFYSTNGKPPSNLKHRVGQQSGGMMGGIMPHLYKNNQFFYEDSSAALDSYEEEYDTYMRPPVGGGNINSIASTPSSLVGPRFSSSSTPRSSTSSVPNFQFLGERARLPSYNQQRATSTPKYKYAHLNNQRGTTSYHQMSSSTERSTIANSDYNQRPSAPLPFSLPRSQDDIDILLKNLGIKLSGCNVVGKMYSVGEVIEELSGDCLRCMCSDIGVHCAERKC